MINVSYVVPHMSCGDIANLGWVHTVTLMRIIKNIFVSFHVLTPWPLDYVDFRLRYCTLGAVLNERCAVLYTGNMKCDAWNFMIIPHRQNLWTCSWTILNNVLLTAEHFLLWKCTEAKRYIKYCIQWLQNALQRSEHRHIWRKIGQFPVIIPIFLCLEKSTYCM